MKFNSTLKLSYPLGATVGVALLLIAGLVGAAELAARTGWARANFPYASLGRTNPELEARWLLLDREVARHGPIDCVVLGSSMSLSAFNAQVFASTYRAASQADLACFNFGIPAMVASQAGEIARLLNETYHPRLLIFGIAARDFSDPVAQNQADKIYGGPWLDYSLGRGFSPAGWLLAHSYAFRDYVGLNERIKNWGNPPKPKSAPPIIDFTQPPDRAAEPQLYTWLANYSVSPAGLAGLEEVLDLQQQGVTVLVMEVPVHPTYIYFFGRGEQDQQLFRATAKDVVESRGALFWPADPGLRLPDPLWFDRNHLNPAGAEVFSQWLALRVAEAVRQGKLAAAGH